MKQLPLDLLSNERVLAAFWKRVDKREPDACWLWRLKPGAGGYGAFWPGAPGYPRIISAHRFSLALKLGRWPAECACHACDVPMCVNPAHLWEGSHQDNAADAQRKGRMLGPVLENTRTFDRSLWPERIRATVEATAGLERRVKAERRRGYWAAKLGYQPRKAG